MAGTCSCTELHSACALAVPPSVLISCTARQPHRLPDALSPVHHQATLTLPGRATSLRWFLPHAVHNVHPADCSPGLRLAILGRVAILQFRTQQLDSDALHRDTWRRMPAAHAPANIKPQLTPLIPVGVGEAVRNLSWTGWWFSGPRVWAVRLAARVLVTARRAWQRRPLHQPQLPTQRVHQGRDHGQWQPCGHPRAARTRALRRETRTITRPSRPGSRWQPPRSGGSCCS